MKKSAKVFAVAALVLIAVCYSMTSAAHAVTFNGTSDYGTDQFGWYYAITGGQFPTGTTPNGDNGSGGTFRFVTDDPAVWGRPASQSGVWQKDDWFPINAGIAVTLKNSGGIVYDNNGLEPGAATPADPNYYDYNFYNTVGKGAHVAYSMSNNFDWVYSGYMKLTADTTVDTLVGYFAYSATPGDGLTGGFDPNNANIGFRMNIWSNVSGDLLPTNTGSFDGDVFTSDATAGTFSWSDTGVNRVGSTSQQDIYRLTYTLASPITIPAGEYWFSHDAVVPEPGTMVLLITSGIGALAYGWRRRRS
jgi:hypothetical protein